MIDKKKYFKIIELYNKENNLTRLIYRVVKNNDENLSFEQLCNLIDKMTNRKKQIEEIDNKNNKEIENCINEFIKLKENEGCKNVYIKNNSLYYEKNDNNYFILTYNITKELSNKHYEEKYNTLYDEIEKSINQLINLEYIKEYEEVKYYISPYSNKRKVKSIVNRYKAIK